ncbi:MAG TPA: hypothetical protein VE544_07570 [Nitrososphaeraceae archaeon]|nr:hypothetical protein [Nitrososphaeraceae archaeon]
MNLKTTSLNGTVAEMKKVALAAFGKAFLFLFDVILGWIFTNDKRQRIFNRVSNTIVIKIKTESVLTDSSNTVNQEFVRLDWTGLRTKYIIESQVFFSTSNAFYIV